MMPVYKSSFTNRWERVKGNISEGIDGNINVTENFLEITFTHLFEYDSCDIVYFAFTYPWTYQDCQNHLKNVTTIMKSD